MKSSAEPMLWRGLLGLFLAAWGARFLATRQASRADLEPALRLGYARSAALLAQSGLAREQGGPWLESFRRALNIQLAAADRLKVDPPLENDLILLETDVMPAARYRLLPMGSSWVLQVSPWHALPWMAPSNAGGPVRPASYPANGRIAYYDLGRIWIADLNGLRMQSLQHVPLLEEGGQLLWDYAGTRLCWMGDTSPAAAAVELGAERGEADR